MLGGRAVDYQAFVQLVMAELDAVDRVARSLAHAGWSSSEADDLVQETYLRAIRSWHTFKLAEYGVRPWLFKILHNVHLNRLKANKRLPRPMDDSQIDDLAPAAEPGPVALTAEQLTSDTEVGRALQRLDPGLRMPLMLWAVDELTYREVADVMGIPIGTVMSRLHRARRKLAELLPAFEVRSNDGSSVQSQGRE